MEITAPPYHVQSTAAHLRGGFPAFAHHESVSALWSKKWRGPCAAGLYPFMDADVADFDPIFDRLRMVAGDDAAVLNRPDEYATPFFPVAERLVAEAEEALERRDSDAARVLFLRAAAAYRNVTRCGW